MKIKEIMTKQPKTDDGGGTRIAHGKGVLAGPVVCNA
jgi:hypothetical protein